MTDLGVAYGAMDVMLAEIATKPDVLATLRRGVGRSLDETPECWPYVVRVSVGKRWREAPAHVTLSLFALHHQSKQPSSLHTAGVSLGSGADQLRRRRQADGGSADGIERRVLALLGATEIDPLAVHLRGLVQLMRAADVGLDYVQLYRDLCGWCWLDSRNRVCLNWARDYFK